MIRSQRVHPPNKSVMAPKLAPLPVILISVKSMIVDPEAPAGNLRVNPGILLFFSLHR